MKSTLLEYYKQKYKVGGKKVPVKSTGMWYQNGDVVVPSNNITMKGPNGEPDYFKKPILGTGVNTGQTQLMQPGQDYIFPSDKAVLEKKMQVGGMKESQQQRFNNYIKGYTSAPRRVSNQLTLPEGLDIDSETIDLIKKLKNIPADQRMNYAGDMTPRLAESLQSGINYGVNTNLPGSLGNISFSGGYNSEQPLSVESLYRGMNYNMQFDKGSINVNPREQALQLKGKGASLTYKRSTSDDEKLNELVFKTQVLPQLGITAGAKYNTLDSFKGVDPLSSNIPSYIANAGIQGQVGPLDYNVRGTYNPDTGYTYQGEGELNFFDDRLNLTSNFSGNQEEGMNQYGLSARAKLAKGLNARASYNKNNMNQPGSYNLGLTYNKFFEDGGEVDDDERDDDKEMVEGIADILKRIKDTENRKQISEKMISDFEEEDVEYNLEDFRKAAKVMKKGGMSSKSVTCPNCGWSWDLADGGSDALTCHKCGGIAKMQMGGMSVPGVNGMIMASSPMSLKDTYKKKK